MASSSRKLHAAEEPAATMAELEIHLMTVAVEALAFATKERSAALLRRAAGVIAAPHEVALELLMVVDVSLYAPSASGTTAFDRLAKAGKLTDPALLQALEVIRRASPRIVSIEAIDADGVVRLHDVATGARLRMLGRDLAPKTIGRIACVRLATFPDGLVRSVGPSLPLDDDALAVAMRFVRPNGRGLVNPQRCAEAVYRHVVRHGCDLVVGLTDLPDGSEPDGDEMDVEDFAEIDEIARDKAALASGTAPAADMVERLRQLARIERVVSCLGEASGHAGSRALRDGYSWVARVMIETLYRRSRIGSAGMSIAEMRADIEMAVAVGLVPAAAKDLFEQHSRTLEARPPAGRVDSDLDRLLQRIRHLRAKTVEQGCTEHEALAAAEKVAELLDRHGLSLSDVDYRRQTCEGVVVDTTRRRNAPLDDCVPTIGAFFDCRTWWEKGADGLMRFTLFGLAGDVEGAHYLYDLIAAVFATEGRAFADSEIYRSLPSGQRRSATLSFQHGLARGINGKLDTIKDRRDAARHTASGHDLVPIKTSLVDDELAKLGLMLTSRARPSKRRVLIDAYQAGTEAGERFEYMPGIENAA